MTISTTSLASDTTMPCFESMLPERSSGPPSSMAVMLSAGRTIEPAFGVCATVKTSSP